MVLGDKFWMPAALGLSSDPKGDLERADELESKALALDPDDPWAHSQKGWILLAHGRNEEAVAELERALALDPSFVDADAGLASTICASGNSTRALNISTRRFGRARTIGGSLLVRRQGVGQFRAEEL